MTLLAALLAILLLRSLICWLLDSAIAPPVPEDDEPESGTYI